MNRFQFDECFDDSDVRKRCNLSGLCQARRYPKGLKGTKDHMMLPMILALGATLVSTDYSLVDENLSSIPFPHPGIIVIRSVDTRRTITTGIAARILDKFKSLYSHWNTADWSGKFLEIDEVQVVLSLVGFASIYPVGRLNWEQGPFPETFNRLMVVAELAKSRFKPSV